MARGRTFTREVKPELMHQLASGARRPGQVCREHGLADSVLARWRQEYAARGEAAFQPPEPTDQQALEQFCGQRALENAALKKGRSLAASRSGAR